jgi:hypothetical protein
VKALDLASWLFPKADQVEPITPNQVIFFDAGGNFEGVFCPACGFDLTPKWWGETIEQDHSDSGFRLESYKTPCCGGSFTLNELHYEWPQALGSFALSIQNPNIGLLDSETKQVLEAALGTPLRVVYQHL